MQSRRLNRMDNKQPDLKAEAKGNSIQEQKKKHMTRAEALKLLSKGFSKLNIK